MCMRDRESSAWSLVLGFPHPTTGATWQHIKELEMKAAWQPVHRSWWAVQPVCINNTGSAAFKHFNPLIHTSLWQIVLSIPGSQLSMDLCSFHSFRNQKMHYCMFPVLGANL
jgi:hypothetical protein